MDELIMSLDSKSVDLRSKSQAEKMEVLQELCQWRDSIVSLGSLCWHTHHLQWIRVLFAVSSIFL